jgi:hypothetical protein
MRPSAPKSRPSAAPRRIRKRILCRDILAAMRQLVEAAVAETIAQDFLNSPRVEPSPEESLDLDTNLEFGGCVLEMDDRDALVMLSEAICDEPLELLEELVYSDE